MIRPSCTPGAEHMRAHRHARASAWIAPGAIRVVAAVACLAACNGTGAMGILIHPFRADVPGSSARCWIDKVSYDRQWYNATGHCWEIATRDNAPRSVVTDVPWSAAGHYNETTGETSESMRIVRGGPDIPTHYYYGTIESRLQRPKDPWREAVPNCVTISVETTDTIPQAWTFDLVKSGARPFTSDLTAEQRSALQREYQAAIDRLHQRLAVHPGTDVQPNSSTNIAMTARGPGATSTEKIPPQTAAAPATRLPGSMLVLTQSPAPEVVEPAPGSTVRQGQLRVRIRDAGAAPGVSNAMATVELTWMPARPSSPNAVPPAAPPNAIKSAQVAVTDLVRGATLPRDVSGAWTGPTLVRVRLGSNGPWSNGVSVTLVSDAAAQARTSTPNWGSAPPSPSKTPNTANSLRPSVSGAPTGSGSIAAPASSLTGH